MSKPVQLVQQEADLIVYVNPELRGCDDWESPPGSGRIFRVGTPDRVLQEYVAEAAAMAEFPQWDQATIQGYFDQGWDIDSLRDWVNNNQ